MQIRKITLRNLHSIRDLVEIDFTDSPLVDTGLFAITGDTGAGKTTILDAVTLALYGDVCRKSDARDTLSYGAEEGMAECEFEAKGRRFLAQWRVRKTKSKKPGQAKKAERSVAEWQEKTQQFHIVAERRVREVNRFIEEVTGLDFPRFTRSVMLAQGDFAAFLKANEKERSDLLERITGTEIYSELSKGALERKNLEKNKLDSLTEKRDALKIFSKEELKEIKGIFKEKQKENKAVKKALEQTKSALAWLQQIKKLERQKESATQLAEELEKEKTNLKDDLLRLETHQKTLPLQPALARLDDKEKEIQTMQNDLEKLALEKGHLTEKASVQAAHFTEKKEQHQALKKGQAKAMELFDEVSSLDAKIQEKEPVVAKEKAALADLQSQLENAQAEQAGLEKKIAESQSALTACATWLESNTALADLPKDLSAIKHFRATLGENYLEQEALKKTVESLRGKLENEKKAHRELEEKKVQEEAIAKKLLARFHELAPEEFATDRHDLLEKMSREIEASTHQKQYLAELKTLAAEYQISLSEINELEAQLTDLRNEETTLDMALLTAMEEGGGAEKNLHYKREIYRQQQAIANYEKDRATLQEGEPCPLCFSTEHPFREGTFTPYIDKAKVELEEAEKFYQSKQAERNTLVKRLLEIASQTRQLDSVSTGQLAKLKNKLLDTERRIAALAPHLDQDDFALSTADRLAQKLSDFDKNLLQKKANREQLAELNGQLTKLETSLRQLEAKCKDSRFAVLETEKNWQHNQQNINALAKKFDQLTNDLNGLVGKYGFSFSIEKGKEMFSDLEKKEREYQQKTADKSSHERQLGLHQQAFAQNEKVMLETGKKIKKQQAALEKATTQLEKLKAKRRELFDEKDPATERERLLESLAKTERETANAKTIYDKTKERLAVIKQSAQSLEKRLVKEQKAVEGIVKKMEKDMGKKGFGSLEELRAAMLPAHEAKRIENKSAKIKQQEIQSQQELKRVEKEWQKLHKKNLTEKTEEGLTEEAAAMETNYLEIQRSIGALEQQLKNNESLESESAELLGQIDAQRSVYNRWMALYDLIGSSDGKKFRVFAQGLTLQKLVQLANTHLANLFGRYFIIKRPGQDLELDIVDTYQADNVRSMHTLSGGESFLVSLALALGLSDLAGKNANIKSLFIDEGFGTLDDQALDLALNTLENLQAKGKTIGIISHVKELKERISTQVQVMKRGGGVSVVEVVG